MQKHSVTIPFGTDQEILLETGHIARQAHGTVIARVGDTVVMANVVHSQKPLEGIDFLPLMVDYREKHYAVGRIPGNFFRREGRPGTPETINARLIDRSIRPLFPKGFRYDTQVYITILSMDQIHPPCIPSLIAASAALSISDIPFDGPIGAIRMGYQNDEFIVNPTFEQRKESRMDLVVSASADSILMVESAAKILTEEVMLDALAKSQQHIQKIIDGINQLVKICGKEKIAFDAPKTDQQLLSNIREITETAFDDIDKIEEKKERETAVETLRSYILLKLAERYADNAPEAIDAQANAIFDDLWKKHVRKNITDKKIRADGRQLNEVRPIEITPAFLPTVHGSALFTRGQTQSLGVTTLGTVGDQQKVDDLMGLSTDRFLLHYNFPSYSVGETRRISGPGRRELGHGNLALRAIEPILPPDEKFPYTIRIVSEITESNGSSSMASICSGCLSLMDAGVPIAAPVAGVAMGLIQEGDRIAVLTDIMGMEDHLGDMDFKVAGTRDGITALQMDNKIGGLSFDVLKQALIQAREGRCFILDRMAEALPEPRAELSPLAPRIEIIKIPVSKIGDLIGPSGKHIRGIVEISGAQVDVEDDGSVFISSTNAESMKIARQMVQDYTAEVELGRIYTGKVVRITDFGAFVELMPKQDGLVHISELDFGRVEKVTDVCQEGDMMKVKVIEIDPGSGKVRLSRRAALEAEPGFVPPEGYDPDRRSSGAGGGGERRSGSGPGRDRDRRPGSGPGRDRDNRNTGNRDRDNRAGGNRSDGVDRGGLEETQYPPLRTPPKQRNNPGDRPTPVPLPLSPRNKHLAINRANPVWLPRFRKQPAAQKHTMTDRLTNLPPARSPHTENRGGTWSQKQC